MMAHYQCSHQSGVIITTVGVRKHSTGWKARIKNPLRVLAILEAGHGDPVNLPSANFIRFVLGIPFSGCSTPAPSIRVGSGQGDGVREIQTQSGPPGIPGRDLFSYAGGTQFLASTAIHRGGGVSAQSLLTLPYEYVAEPPIRPL